MANEKKDLKGVEVSIHFYDTDAGKVDLVWGINGWRPVPEPYWGKKTKLNEKGSLDTEMRPLGHGRFVADLRLPAGSKIDAGFSVKETLDGFTTTRWIEGSPLNYTLVRKTGFNWPGKLPLWNMVQRARKARVSVQGGNLNRFSDIEWRQAAYTRFIVLADTRTGSTMLWKLLDSHPHIEMRNELFNPENPSQKKQERFGNAHKHPVEALTEFLDDHIYLEYDEGIQAAGFKYIYGHKFVGDWNAVWTYFQRTKIHIIHLKRRNLLDRYLSFALAMRSNHWVAKDSEANRQYNEPINIDPTACIENIHKTRKEQKLYDTLFRDNPKIELIYEDLVEHHAEETGRILNFLNVDDRPLAVSSIKQRRKPKSEVIANYDALKAVFEAGAAAGDLPASWLTFFDDE